VAWLARPYSDSQEIIMTLRILVPAVAALLGAAAAAPAAAQERIHAEVNERIRAEGLGNSQIAQLAGYMTEVIGPRLTGSPGMKRANEWTAEQFRSWGLTNVRVEPWGTFGRGWERESFYARMTAPFVQPLQGQPLAWTGSTAGRIAGEVVVVHAATPEELQSKYRGRLRGAIVAAAPPVALEPEWTFTARRFNDAGGIDRFGERREVPSDPVAQEAVLRQQAMQREINELLAEEQPALILRPSPWQYGVLRVAGGGSRAVGAPEGPAMVMLAAEHYNQIWRNAVLRDVPSHVEFEVRNRFFEDDLQAYNTLAELRGSDRADEYVIIGAHLDSWHGGQGATDNAAGSVIMMEAMRILRAIDVQPRRTIKIGLWSGEEQGLHGSREWVAANQALWPRISAYLNIDNGTGRVRGIWTQSNEAAGPIFEQLLAPFRDLDVVRVAHGNTGGTDHLSFDRVGLPGFNFIQDPIEYGIRTHHSHMDTFDRLVLDDLRQAAVVVASVAYHIAMRDELMPRKPQTDAR
jgi:carboxypeptidase Q